MSLHTALVIHAALLGMMFACLIPLAALSQFLPLSNSIPRVHAPFQLLNICLVIIGVAFGAKTVVDHGQSYVGYHPLIGTVTVVLMVVPQPVLGLLQHIKFRRTGRSTHFGKLHRWLGRTIYVLDSINGGLGFRYGGPLGTSNCARVGSFSLLWYFRLSVACIYWRHYLAANQTTATTFEG